MNLKNRMYRVKDAYLAPEVDEEFINGSPYGERSPKYNTFDYNEKCAIQRCKEQGGEWMVFIENIGGEPSYDFGMSDGLRVDEEFNAWGEIPSRVLEIVENRNGKVYVEGVSEDVTTIPERNYVEDSHKVSDGFSSDLCDAINMDLMGLSDEIEVSKCDENRVLIETTYKSYKRFKDDIEDIMSEFGYTYNKSYPMKNKWIIDFRG